MRVEVKPSALRETKGHEYAVRFALGGLITVVAGLIARRYGPSIGGLFLAFPAIFPASATLVAKHERQKHHSRHVERLASDAAGVDAIGAALGSLGLLAFGGVVWALGAHTPAWAVLLLAALAWVICSLVFWVIRQKI